MAKSDQEIVAHAFSLLWARIFDPHSACPDVELNRIEQEMTLILQSLSHEDGPAEEQWVLAQLLLGPRSLENFQWGWSEYQDPRLPIPTEEKELEVFYSERDNRMKSAYEAITRAVEDLLGSGRIEWVEDDAPLRLRLP